MAEGKIEEKEEKPLFASQPKLFGKWDYSEVKLENLCFKDYVAVTSTKSQVYVPHTAGKYQVKKFRK